jgi:hypothetical protein
VPVGNEEFAAEAERILLEAEKAGVTLRILGSIAYRVHCPGTVSLFERMDRALTDIDFASEKSQGPKIQRLMEQLGYVEDKGTALSSEGRRLCFTSRDGKLNVDVFMDELYFCHRIPLKDRLRLDSPTIPVTDLLLEKMQIVEINLKDLKDTVVLLLEHEVADGDPDREHIDLERLGQLLAADWGFYHTVTTNLAKVREYADRLEGLGEELTATVDRRIARILEALEKRPKSLGWRMRARVGTRVKWYQEVSGKEATYMEDQA